MEKPSLASIVQKAWELLRLVQHIGGERAHVLIIELYIFLCGKWHLFKENNGI